MDAALAVPRLASAQSPVEMAAVTVDDRKRDLPGVGRYIVLIAERADRDAFKALFLAMAPKVKAFLLRRAVEAPDELTQEVMLAVWRKAALFDPTRGTGEAWIFAIARNACIDAARRRRGAPLVDFDPMSDREAPDQGDERLQAVQTGDQIRAALETLPPEQLEVVRLSFFDDEPHSAIAARLDLPVGTVKSRLRLAMKRLRDVLGGEA